MVSSSEWTSTDSTGTTSPVSIHSTPLSGKAHTAFVPSFGELSLDVLAYIVELDNSPVPLPVDDENLSQCHFVDVVGSPTVIIDSSDSEDSDFRDVSLPDSRTDAALRGGLPVDIIKSSLSSSSHVPLIIEHEPVLTTAPSDPPIHVSSVGCTGPSDTTDSQSLIASYRDILLAHLPTFTDISSTKPGVGPLRYRDVTICRLKRRARGTGPIIDPGPGGMDDGYIPLFVRLEMASDELATRALRGNPLTLGSK